MKAARPLPVVLYCDEHLVAIDKPAGVAAVPGRGAGRCAMELLRARPEFVPAEPLRVVHRIDREASGVLVYARTLAAQRGLVAQFMQRRVQKLYLALVSGYVAGDGRIDLPLYFDPRRNRAVVSHKRGKPALTYYRVLRRVAGNTWIECRPLTGRRHQIRVHLAASGHPLTVDPLYGGGDAVRLSFYKPKYRPNRRGQERPLIERLTLHAARIEFEHPLTGVPVAVEAPLPKDLRATLAQLSRLA